MMDPRHLFIDERHTGMCAYCGMHPDTRDHVPSKVLLDEPSELPLVGACKKCNASFSLDEQYLACFLDCVICGSAGPGDLHRPNVRRILKDSPALRRRLERTRKRDDADNLLWESEPARVQNVVLKLARGHVAYELYPKLEEPTAVSFAPLQTLSDEERLAFEQFATDDKVHFWPEIGSRAFLRALGKSPDGLSFSKGWVVVQPHRYRYAVLETGGVLVRMVLSEYLACEVIWEY
ncbi:MAG: hypothetical protein P8Z79_26245 [Sedimentisphaerales bacterium]